MIANKTSIVCYALAMTNISGYIAIQSGVPFPWTRRRLLAALIPQECILSESVGESILSEPLNTIIPETETTRHTQEIQHLGYHIIAFEAFD